MDATIGNALIRRVLSHLDRHTTDSHDDVTTRCVAPYSDPLAFEREIDAIFMRGPQFAGHLGDLAGEGSYLTRVIQGRPVVLLNDGGVLRALSNVCLHRAAELLPASTGRVIGDITCRYHGWRYDKSGRVVAIPSERSAFPSWSPQCSSLETFGVASLGGLVWVHARGPGDVSLDIPGELSREFSSLGLDALLPYRADSEIRQFNWKLGMEGFLENYHFAFLHRDTTDSIFITNVVVMDVFGPHIRAVAPKRSIRSLASTTEGDWNLREHATLLYVFFPNVCVFVERDHCTVVEMVPTSPTSTEVRTAHYVSDDSQRSSTYWDANIRMFDSAADQDLDMCESMQRGVLGNSENRVCFGRNERGLTEFRAAVDRSLAAT